MENAVLVDVMPVMLLIFSTVLNALMGSLVFNRITRSKRPVTGVTYSMLLTRLSWLTMCPSSPLAFAKTKLVDADLDIFSLKSTGRLHAICQRRNPATRPPVTLELPLRGSFRLLYTLPQVEGRY